MIPSVRESLRRWLGMSRRKRKSKWLTLANNKTENLVRESLNTRRKRCLSDTENWVAKKKARRGRVVSETDSELSEYHMKYSIECLKRQYFSDKESSNSNCFITIKIRYPNSPHVLVISFCFLFTVNSSPQSAPRRRLICFKPVWGRGGLIETTGLFN